MNFLGADFYPDFAILFVQNGNIERVNTSYLKSSGSDKSSLSQLWHSGCNRILDFPEAEHYSIYLNHDENEKLYFNQLFINNDIVIYQLCKEPRYRQKTGRIDVGRTGNSYGEGGRSPDYCTIWLI